MTMSSNLLSGGLDLKYFGILRSETRDILKKNALLADD